MKSLSRVRCFLFDLDGTLVDSSPLHERAFVSALAAQAPHLLADFHYEAVKGKPTGDAFLSLGVDEPELVARLTADKQRLFRESVEKGELAPIAGARQLLATLRERGCTLFLVTSGSRGSVAMSLEATRLAASFEGVITSDDTARSKPDPDPFLACLSRFSLDPATCVAVEDSRSGIASARAAGLPVIGVNNPAVADQVDLYFPTLADMTDWALTDGHGRVA